MFQTNPLALLLGLALIFLVITSYVTWQRSSSSSTARCYVYLLLSAAAYLLGYILELSSTTLDWILVWVRIENTALCFVAVTSVSFLISYIRHDDWLKLPYVRLALTAVPLLHFVIVWTDRWFGLAYTYSGTILVDGLVYFDRVYANPYLFSAAALLAMEYVALGLAMLHLVRIGSLSIRQLLPLLIAAVLVTVSAVLTVSRDLSPVPYIDLSGIGLALACIPLGWSIYRENLFQLIPAAQKWIVQSMRDPIIILDVDGWVVDLNAAAGELLQMPPEEARGKQLRELSPGIGVLLDSPPAAPIDAAMEVLLNLPDGGDIGYEYQHTAIATPQGRNVGRALIFHDISTRKQTRTQSLKLELEREKVRVTRELVVGIAHDFRTPLSEINLKAYLLSATRDSEKQKTMLTEINERIHYIDGLISDMQFIIDLETSANMATFEQVRLDELRSSVTAYIAKLTTRKALNLQLDCPPTDAVVFCNPEHLKRALREIADNAGKFTPEGGTITLRCGLGRNSVRIEIEDTGSGIEPEHLPHIFEWFFKPPARSAGGAGLGLPICRSIIEQHGGTVSVRSTVGVGSCFTIELPLLRNANGFIHILRSD